MRRLSFFLFCCLFTCGVQQALAQTDSTDKKTVFIQHADRFNNMKKDTLELFSAAGKVFATQGTTKFYCDSMVQDHKHNTLEAFGHVHINDNDSVNTYSDYMKYIAVDKQAYLKKNVKLTDGKGVLTTNDLSYNLNTKLGIYLNGGRLVNDSSVLNSTEAYYHGDTRDVTFKKKVKLVNPQYTIVTDTLLYNTYTKVATFTVPTVITSDKQQIHTKDGYYDMLNKKSYFGKRSELVDDSTSLIADEVMNDSSGYSEAQGNVFIRDLKQGYTLLANNVKSNKKDGSFLATQKPILILKQDADSIFVAADTFYSARLSELRKERTVPVILDTNAVKKMLAQKPDSSRDRFIEAYYHVRIYSDSLQAVGDSMFYSAEDSAFRLFKNPVIWSQESQVTGDTIYLFTENRKPKRMYVFENGLLLNKVSDNASYYNQVRGRTINGYFKDGSIDYLRAKGNAENIYYALDEGNKYIGVNKSSANAIDMFFEEKKPKKVKWISDVHGNMSPMGQVNHEDIKLKGFKWLDNIRPKSEYDLFGD